jgi:predicted phosphodiesterase
MRYIGDVHGKMKQYVAITQGIEASIQVGDFGAGFSPLPNIDINHRFIRGNHDDPAICAKSPNWIPDGTIDNDTFFVGGAYSIDKDDRTIGRDWWDDEEISWGKLNELIDVYANVKPRIMVTHDCPRQIATTLWSFLLTGGSRTSSALQAMLEIHQPEIWLFGHYHTNINKVINGTQFICLAELEYIDI